MKPILFESTETSFTSNGLGRIDALSCVVTEERNGQYELELEVSIDDEHYSDIQEGRILYARHDETTDKQPFDIYYISRPLNGRVTVLAHHISYRTHKITVAPFSATSPALAMSMMETHSIGNNPFTLWTNKSGTSTMAIEQPKTLRELLSGEQGSLLDVYGKGEYEWDKFTIKLYVNRGVDSGVTLRYGKDITELKKTTDITNVWTGIVPYWYGSPESESGSASTDEQVLVMLPEEYIEAENASSYGYKMIVPLDMTSYFDTPPTQSQLREVAEQYVADNAKLDIPTTVEFSFINVASLDEYENVAALQRLSLCDTLTVRYDRLGVANKAKIIKTVFDVLKEKYISMTVGDVGSSLSATLTDGIKGALNDLKTSTSQAINRTRRKMEQRMQTVISEQTELITGGSGGNVVLKRDANGKPTDILIMDNANMNQALQVLRINVNGIGFSSRGINGPYASAWTLDGKFNADYIQVGSLNANLLTVGAITDINSTNYWNLETGEFRLAATTTVGGSTVSSIASNAASSAISSYDSTLTQQNLFNKLTNNGTTQGIYLSNNKLYINADYIQAGTLSANRIRAGVLYGTNNDSVKFDLDAGELYTTGFPAGYTFDASVAMKNGELQFYDLDYTNPNAQVRGRMFGYNQHLEIVGNTFIETAPNSGSGAVISANGNNISLSAYGKVTIKPSQGLWVSEGPDDTGSNSGASQTIRVVTSAGLSYEGDVYYYYNDLTFLCGILVGISAEGRIP